MSKLPDRCAECGDRGPLYLHSRCHPNKPTWCVLAGDTLTIHCAKCDKIVARYRVVKDPD